MTNFGRNFNKANIKAKNIEILLNIAQIKGISCHINAVNSFTVARSD